MTGPYGQFGLIYVTDLSQYEEYQEKESFDIAMIQELKDDVEEYITHKVVELGI